MIHIKDDTTPTIVFDPRTGRFGRPDNPALIQRHLMAKVHDGSVGAIADLDDYTRWFADVLNGKIWTPISDNEFIGF